MKTLAGKFLEVANFKAVCKIDYNDLDDLINEYFGQPQRSYESVAYEEWGNDSDHSFTVEKDDVDMDTINDALMGKWEHFSLSEYLNHLCNEGIIPECELIVSVCW